MTDLFAAAECHREERAAVLEFDAGTPRATAESMAAKSSEARRHACETRSVVAMYQTQGGEAVKAFLDEVAKKRGQAAADRLRTDAMAELKKMAGASSTAE